MNLDEVLHTFLAEARDLLEQMEEALLQLENESEDDEAINALFRAAHTIKGSAGLFQLDEIVAFTHVAENVLDRVRDGHQALVPDLIKLLFEVRDHLGVMIDGVAAGQELAAADSDRTQTLIDALTAYQSDRAEFDIGGPEPVERQPEAQQGGDGNTGVVSAHWHISVRFGPDLLVHGMDPLSFIRYLGTLGRLVHVVTLTDALPAPAQFDPERCYLGFELAFDSEADRDTIEGVFEFVRDDSRLFLLPPHAPLSDYAALLQAAADADEALGPLLLACGSLSEEELTALSAPAIPTTKESNMPQSLAEPAQAQTPVQRPDAKAKGAQRNESQPGAGTFIRVDAQKLDQLINLVGELIIAGANTELIAQKSGDDELAEATSNLSQLVEQVRDSALTLRMVPIGATFNRFQRVVRDVGKELGKEIELIIAGADTELDKTVVEKIGDPLTHLVRNAMDHGIESAELRRERGKPARGRLKLDAYHDSGNIVIEVSDDGGGLDRDRILAKALERGLVKEDQSLTDKEVYQLIFEPGFSTAAQVSNLSGRGVGMDVVARNIQALRGTVELDSEPGRGATVRIRLPLTLAIIDGFMVSLSGAVYVIPQDLVVECIELTQRTQERDYLNLRGEVLPYIRLRELFEVEGELPERENVVVVQYNGQKAGLVVDALLGEFQTVIKPLGKVFSRAGGIGGFTILGNGNVALILEVPGLVRQVVERAGGAQGNRQTGSVQHS